MGVLIYWAMPGSGASEFGKMNQALQNARSWRVHTVVAEPTKNVESTTEVYCPSRVHAENKIAMDEGGTHYEDASELIWIEGASYTRKGLRWKYSHEERNQTASCVWGPRGTDTLLAEMDAVVRLGKIRKGEKRFMNDTQCQEWIASVPAPAGWRDMFIVCIGSDHLPREVSTPDRSQVSSYADWNKPIRIEAPAQEDVDLK
jgi:hypothetical protein